MGQCDCPNLIHLKDTPLTHVEIESLDCYFYTEELIEGKNLQEILDDEGPLSNLELLKLGQQVGTAIGELSNNKVIHRDIKPSNIMRRDSNGEYVLLDIGLGLHLEESSITARGYIVGTIPYMSPEQIRIDKGTMDFRSDLFALGIVLYETATGVYPFGPKTGTDAEIINGILNTDAPDPTGIRGELDANLAKVILRLLEKEPHLRFRTPGHFIDTLEEIGKSLC